MKTLIVGMGALGGVIAARLLAAGEKNVALATRDRTSADALKSSGLRVSGIGGDAQAQPTLIAAVDDFLGDRFDLIVLATKAHAAIELGPKLAPCLADGGTLFRSRTAACLRCSVSNWAKIACSADFPISARRCIRRAFTNNAMQDICSSANFPAA